MQQPGGDDDVVMQQAGCLGSQGEVGEISDLRLRFGNIQLVSEAVKCMIGL